MIFSFDSYALNESNIPQYWLSSSLHHILWISWSHWSIMFNRSLCSSIFSIAEKQQKIRVFSKEKSVGCLTACFHCLNDHLSRLFQFILNSCFPVQSNKENTITTKGWTASAYIFIMNIVSLNSSRDSSRLISSRASKKILFCQIGRSKDSTYLAICCNRRTHSHDLLNTFECHHRLSIG